MTNPYIIRECNGRRATLVEPKAPEGPYDATETRTEYTEHGGLLCRIWNRGNGQGNQFQEVGTGLHPHGRTVPASRVDNIARLVQREATGVFRINLPIQDAQ